MSYGPKTKFELSKKMRFFCINHDFEKIFLEIFVVDKDISIVFF